MKYILLFIVALTLNLSNAKDWDYIDIKGNISTSKKDVVQVSIFKSVDGIYLYDRTIPIAKAKYALRLLNTSSYKLEFTSKNNNMKKVLYITNFSKRVKAIVDIDFFQKGGGILRPSVSGYKLINKRDLSYAANV